MKQNVGVLLACLMAAAAIFTFIPISTEQHKLVGYSVYFLTILIGISSGLYSAKEYGWESLHGKISLAGSAAFLLAGIANGFIAYSDLILKNLSSIMAKTATASWAICYVPIAAALLYTTLFVKPSKKSAPVYVVIGIFSSLLLIALLILPLLSDPNASSLSKFIWLSLPITDLLMVLAMTNLYYNMSGMLTHRVWIYFIVGTLFFALGDASFSYLSWKGVYSRGSFTDLFWNAACILISYGLFKIGWLVEEIKRDEFD